MNYCTLLRILVIIVLCPIGKLSRKILNLIKQRKQVKLHKVPETRNMMDKINKDHF